MWYSILLIVGIMYKFLLVGLVLVCSCAKAPSGWNAPIRPYAMRISETNRLPVDSDFTKGFNDGCVGAQSIITAGAPQMMHPRVDGWKMTGRDPNNPEKPHPDIKSGKDYLNAWFDGFEHCTYYYDWWVL